METEDVISLHDSSSPTNGSESNELDGSGCEPSGADLQAVEVEEAKVNSSEIPQKSGDIVDGDNQLFLAANSDKDMVDEPPSLEVRFELAETVAETRKTTYVGSVVHAENGCLAGKDESDISDCKADGFWISSQETHTSSLSGVKRPRVTIDDQQPSVQVIYKSLARDSRKKLEELLQQWSQWHANHCSSSNVSSEVLESGQETYFPALQVGLDKSSAVTFWMDNETRNELNKEFIPFDGTSVPLYDRGYALALTSMDGSSNLEGLMEIGEASRCFNCGSYNHSLKECPKPRDNVAVNNARKQHKSKRNQNASGRNQTRYYQNSPGGKYDGLKPGTLDTETRQLLGLGEFDPPPWLNRMREIGYPPGYIDPEDEDQPSGITIFGDEQIKEDREEGEILENSNPEPAKKKSVGFPGVNAPIPENADEKRWAAGPSDLHPSRNHSHGRYSRQSDPIPTGRGHYHESRWSRDSREEATPLDRGHYPESRWSRDFGEEAIPIGRGQYHESRWSRDFTEDEPPPPGCEPESPSLSSYSRRYGGYDTGYVSHSPRDSPSVSNFGRSFSDRSRRSPLVYDSSPRHRAYGSLPYSSPR